MKWSCHSRDALAQQLQVLVQSPRCRSLLGTSAETCWKILEDFEECWWICWRSILQFVKYVNLLKINLTYLTVSGWENGEYGPVLKGCRGVMWCYDCFGSIDACFLCSPHCFMASQLAQGPDQIRSSDIIHDVQRFRVRQGAGEHHTSTRSHADALHHSMLRGAHLLCSDDLMDVRQWTLYSLLQSARGEDRWGMVGQKLWNDHFWMGYF